MLGNHYLGCAIAEAWRDQLVDLGIDRCTLYVNNEYRMVFEDGSDRVAYEQIVPTIRLWSYDADMAESMNDVYQPERSGPTRVFWAERKERWHDLDEVIRFMSLGSDHPEKLRIIDECYADPTRRYTHIDL